MTQERKKPLGGKSYGHIPHLPGSRMGVGDHKCSDGQKRICCERVRDKHDLIIVQEKLDGSNVGIARIEGLLYPLTRAGYLADTSPFEQHWRFGEWVYANQGRFLELLSDGERVCGEWLMQAHGTRYILPHEPFVPFDIIRGNERVIYEEFSGRVLPLGFTVPRLIHADVVPFSIDSVLKAIETSGHGALDPVEGAVWRVERNELVAPGKSNERRRKVDFLAKFVRPEKLDGTYLPEVSGGYPVWNWLPEYKN